MLARFVRICRIPSSRVWTAIVVVALLGEVYAVLNLPPHIPAPSHRRNIPGLKLFTPKSAADLVEQLGSGSAGRWADILDPGCGVAPLAPDSLPRDMALLDTSQKKALFVRALLPHVLYQNNRIRRDREFLTRLRADGTGLTNRGAEDRARLENLFRRYRLSSLTADGIISPEDIQRLLVRVNVVPVSLALAQAAMESGWGTSRFVHEGNNIFGQWQFGGGSGIVPRERPPGETYTIARFSDLAEAVERYMLNLNTHRAYRSMRQIRARLENADAPLDPEALAQGLALYSSRRDAYVRDIIKIIRHNDLAYLDRMDFAT